MKILVTTWVDAANLTIENIVKEMIARGHQIEIYAFYTDAKSIRMFTALNLPIHDAKKLNRKTIEQFDVAFTAESAMRALRFADIYIFSYNNIPDTLLTDGADFMFTMVRDRKLRWYEDCAVMPIGNTKNDTPKIYLSPQKQILFIDAGHNPLGRNGKTQVAKMLLSICKHFSDYKLVVKPRWLRSDGNQTHRTSLHIYDVLEEITNFSLPENLILLEEHRNLQELIDESVSVITTSASCYLDIALRGKGFLVVDGLDGEESFDTRASFRNVYNDARNAGCCVDYRDIIKYLPNGIFCKPEHLAERIPYNNGVSKRIVDVIEYIYDNCICLNKYPAIQQYDYESYKEILSISGSIPFRELKQKRMKNGMLLLTRFFTWIYADIDFDSYFQILDEIYSSYPLTEAGFHALEARMLKERRTIILENSDKCMDDPINQSLLLQCLGESGREDVILSMAKGAILCTGPYHYHLGMIYSKRKQPDLAGVHFCEFLKEANARSFNKYPQESDWGIRNAYNYVFGVYDGENIDSADFADLCADLYRQRTSTLVEYNRRKRVHNLLPKTAERLKDNDPKRAFICLQLYAKYEYHYNIRECNCQINSLKRDIMRIQGSRLYRFCCTARWWAKKTRGGINCVREHGLGFTIRHSIQKIQKSVNRKIENHILFKMWMHFHNLIMDGYRLYADLVQRHGRGSYIQIMPSSNGDVYVLLKYYKQYIKKNFAAVNNIAVSSCTAFKSIADWFGILNTEHISNSQWLNLIRLYVFLKGTDVNINILHHHLLIRHTGILTYLEGIHGLVYMEMLESILFEGFTPTVPNKKFDDAEIERVFSENGLLAGKTVMLSPYAQSLKSISEEYWIRLAEELKKAGFAVCTNAFGTQFPVEDTIKIELGFPEMQSFLDMAGYFVSRRSGVDDITRESSCVRIEVYAKENLKRGDIVTIVDNFRYVDDPIIVGDDNIEACVTKTLQQLGIMSSSDEGKE